MTIEKLNTPADAKAPTEQVAKKQQEFRLIGKVRKQRGHTLFEFNRETKEIRKAEITRKAQMQLAETVKYKTDVNVKPDCFYLQALNATSAAKKLRKNRML